MGAVGCYRPDSVLGWVRELANPYRSLFPLWFVYSLPLGVWVYACTGFFCRLWRSEGGWIYLGSVLLPGCLVGCIEVLQSLSMFRGTFDWWDILLCVIGSVGGLLVSRSW